MEVSIVIPMRNEERFVTRCLDSILAQLGNRDDVEVLCVDGASEDGTARIVAEYAARDPRVRLLSNPQRIVPVAMNLALAAARGRFIMRLDCHAEYDADYVAASVEVLERTGADIVGGYLTTLPGQDTPVGRAIAAATSSRFGVGGSAFRTGGGEQEVDAFPFGTFRRTVFERVGVYDERLVRNQDIELTSRARAAGCKVMLSPSIRLTYFTRSTFAGLRQQSFNNGLWNPYTVWLTGGGLRPRHFVPLAFVLSLVGLALLGFLWWGFWILLVADAALYGTVATLMARRAAPSANAAPLLILRAFVELHIWYGLGSFWGLLTAPFKFGWSRQAGANIRPLERRD